MVQDRDVGTVPDEKMVASEVVLEDGRYLVYYSFEEGEPGV